MFGLGFSELAIILVIILLLFGAKKLPELARSMGEGAKELRKGFNEDVNDDSSQAKNSQGTKKNS